MPAGRPSKLTPALIADVRRFLPVCLYLDMIGDYLGIARSTWHAWLQRGRQEADRLAYDAKAAPLAKEAVYLEFLDTYKKGLAEGEMFAIAVIRDAALKHWQAAAWLLERRWPHKWGKDRQTLHALQQSLRDLHEQVRAAVSPK